jgi:hypothetical protein
MNAVPSYLTSPFLLQGALLAVEISMVLGLLLGLVLALRPWSSHVAQFSIHCTPKRSVNLP